MGYFTRNIIKYREYIWYSAKAQLKSELSSSMIGWIWWILEPTLYMVIYFYVFTVVFKRQTEYVVAVINIGLLYWRFFNNCLLTCTKLIKKNRTIISKVYLPKFVFVCSVMLVNLFKMVCAFVPVIILLIWYRIPFSWQMFQIIPLTLAYYVIVFSACCWFMHIGVYFPDVERVLPIALRMLFYLSGVFYPIDAKLDNKAAEYMLKFNPVATVITSVRDSMLFSRPVHANELIIQTSLFIILGIIGIITIKNYESKYIKRI